MVDKTGSIARWRQQNDIMSFGSETEGPKKLQAFALIPPAADGIQARLHGTVIIALILLISGIFKFFVK